MRGGCGVEGSKLMHQQGKCSLLRASLQLDQGNYTLALFALSKVYLILKLHTCRISNKQGPIGSQPRCQVPLFRILHLLLPAAWQLCFVLNGGQDELGSYYKLPSRRSNCHHSNDT